MNLFAMAGKAVASKVIKTNMQIYKEAHPPNGDPPDFTTSEKLCEDITKGIDDFCNFVDKFDKK